MSVRSPWADEPAQPAVTDSTEPQAGRQQSSTHLIHYLLGEADVVTRRRWFRWTATAEFNWHGTVRVAKAWTEAAAVVRLSRELPR